MAITGNSATISLGTSGFTASFTELGGSEQTREALEVSHLGTTTFKEYDPDDLVEPGEVAGMFHWNPNFGTFPPITGAAETITISYPLPSGASTPGTLSGTGFLTRSKGGDLKNGEISIGELTIKWDGKTGPAYTAGS